MFKFSICEITEAYLLTRLEPSACRKCNLEATALPKVQALIFSNTLPAIPLYFSLKFSPLYLTMFLENFFHDACIARIITRHVVEAPVSQVGMYFIVFRVAAGCLNVEGQ